MSDNSNASTMMVALIAIVVIMAIGFIVLRVIPGAGDTDDGASINIDVPNTTPNE